MLNDFVEDSDNVEMMVEAAQTRDWRNSRLRKSSVNEDDSSNEDVNDPEEAFLSISQNLRQAFKKHLPLVRLIIRLHRVSSRWYAMSTKH